MLYKRKTFLYKIVQQIRKIIKIGAQITEFQGALGAGDPEKIVFFEKTLIFSGLGF